MNAPTGSRRTYDEFARLPDDGDRYEVIDGEVRVTPAPSPAHQHVLLRLSLALHGFVEDQALGVVLPGVDLLFVEGTLLCPDLLFVPNDGRAGITSRGVETTPGLVVEIVSPSSRATDRVLKPQRYRDFGVPEYWVVDPDARVVQVWRFGEDVDPTTVHEVLTWSPPATTARLEIGIEGLFGPM